MSLTVELNPCRSLSTETEASEDWSASYTLYKDIQNMAELQQKLIKGELKAALINPCLIVDLFQVTIAVNKAVRSKLLNKMKTRNIFTEIIFNLSPDRKISQALQIFGIDGKGDSLLVVRVFTGKGEEPFPLNTIINGNVSPLEDLKSLTDEERLKKVYKLTEEEIKNGCLVDSVVCRMALKDVS